jgi:uncharacterized protein YmfQ (DUF2313 family)
MATLDQIMTLTKQLLPTGRAWWMPARGPFERLMTGLQLSESRAYDDARSILDSIFPDNNNFTADDATAWETRLGLVSNQLVALSDRKMAIQRKMNHPGSVAPRQNYRYLEGQLRDAGFDVHVYENRFADYYQGYVTKTPTQFSTLPYPLRSVQYGEVQYGNGNYGLDYSNKIANSINESIDNAFLIGTDFRSTFFIGGSTPGSWAIVDVNRKTEFRQLVLKIKPVQTVAFLLINFY